MILNRRKKFSLLVISLMKARNPNHKIGLQIEMYCDDYWVLLTET